jgi:hypothetical protein
MGATEHNVVHILCIIIASLCRKISIVISDNTSHHVLSTVHTRHTKSICSLPSSLSLPWLPETKRGLRSHGPFLRKKLAWTRTYPYRSEVNIFPKLSVHQEHLCIAFQLPTMRLLGRTDRHRPADAFLRVYTCIRFYLWFCMGVKLGLRH